MINTVTEGSLVEPKKVLKGIVNCPVDIEIYNRENDLIGKIKDNQVVEGLDSKVTQILALFLSSRPAVNEALIAKMMLENCNAKGKRKAI